MLAIARALMSKPKLIMMDEPSLGLAPIIVEEIFNIIRDINKDGISILLVEQNCYMALNCTARICIRNWEIVHMIHVKIYYVMKVQKSYLGG